MRGKKEESEQLKLCRYIRLQYPDVIFTSESSGIRLTIGQATKLKRQRSKGKFPDLMIFEPRGNYKGLFIEMKKSMDEFLTKKGELRKNEHIQKQYEMLCRLDEKGYFSTFAGGFEHGKNIVDQYMRLKNNCKLATK